MMSPFEKSTPEEVGISSKHILNFINKLSSSHIPMHSLLIARYDKIITNAYYAPFEANTLHRMFSISKSFTSIAIGELIHQGKLSLDDRIVSFFPEYLPPHVHPYIEEMTIQHMLTMKSCYTSTTYKEAIDQHWVKSFFNATPSHRPGTSFNYDTSASHTLCALVEKLTGQLMLDFLRDVALSKVGFSDEAYIIKDPFNHSMGGSGLMATSYDLLLFSYLLLNKGNFNHSQLLSKSYIEDATSNHSFTYINGPTKEERYGYGYQIWQIRDQNFACYGMGGQLAICFPKLDMIIVTTADTQGLQGGNQLIYDSLFEELIDHVKDIKLPSALEDYENLEAIIKNLEITPLQGNYSSVIEKSIHKTIYNLDLNTSNFDQLSISIDPTSKLGTLDIKKNDTLHTIFFGFGYHYTSIFPIYNQKCCTSAVWINDHTLYIKSHIIDESIGSIHIHLTFLQNKVSVYMKKIEESYFQEFSGYFEGLAISK